MPSGHIFPNVGFLLAMKRKSQLSGSSAKVLPNRGLDKEPDGEYNFYKGRMDLIRQMIVACSVFFISIKEDKKYEGMGIHPHSSAAVSCGKPDPVAKPGYVVIDVKAAGLCHQMYQRWNMKAGWLSSNARR